MPSHAIHLKAFFGDIEAIERLLDSNPEIINILNDNNETPIFLACHRGHVSAIELLIKEGADLSIPDRHGSTPLHRVMGIMATALSEGKEVEVYHRIVEIILQKDMRLMSIRDQYLAYPLYKLYSHEKAIERVLLLVKKLGSICQILPFLINDLQHIDISIKQKAAIILSRIYQIDPETRQDILQAFIQFFHGEQNPCKWDLITKPLLSIMQTQLDIDPATLQQIVSNFIGYLNDKTIPYTVIIDCIDILGEACKLNPETVAPQIIPSFVRILNTDNDIVRKKVMEVLGNVGKRIPQNVFKSIHSFIQSLSNQTESLDVRKYVLDTLVSICEAIPEIAPQIVFTLVSSLRNKAEGDELKGHITTALQKICVEIATIEDKQKILEIAWQINPILEQALKDDGLDLKFKQPLGKILAEMYLGIPGLKDKQAAAQAEKAAAKVEEERRAKSPKSDTPKLSAPPTIWSQMEPSQEKQPLLTHRKVPHTEDNTP